MRPMLKLARYVLAGIFTMLASATFIGLSTAQAATGSVLFMVPTLDDEAYTRQIAIAKEQAKKYPDISFEFTAMTARDAASEFISKIEGGVTKNVDVIVLNPGSAAEQLGPALTKAREAGVKVVVLAHGVTGFEADALIEIDARAMTVPSGKYMAGKLRSGDKVALMRCALGSKEQIEFEEGFREGIAGSGIEVVEAGDSKCDAAEGRKLVENWLTTYPDLKGVYSDADIALTGAIEAIKAANRDIVVVGNGAASYSVPKIVEGDILQASAVYPFWTFGSYGVDTAARIVAGEAVEKNIKIPPEDLITKENGASYLERLAAMPR